MKDYRSVQRDGEQTPSGGGGLQTFLDAMRILATVLGMILMVIGLIYVSKLFYGIYNALQDPEAFGPLLEQWAQVMGGEDLSLITPQKEYDVSRLVAIVVLGGGAYVLIRLALGLLTAGAKIISITAGDRAAVKKILTTAFGPQAKPTGQGQMTKNK